MDTTIVKEILSDGSSVYNVVTYDDERTVTLAAVDEVQAERVQLLLSLAIVGIAVS